MLHIILLILKILLWILLAVVALAVLLFVLVLFSPISYRVIGEAGEHTSLKIKLRYLVFSLAFCYDGEGKKTEMTGRALWFLIFPFKEKTPKKKKTKRKNESDTAGEDNLSIKEKAAEGIAELVKDSGIVGSALDEETDNEEPETSQEKDSEDAEESSEESSEESFEEADNRKKGIIAAIKRFIEKLKKFSPENIENWFEAKTKNIKRRINRFKKFWKLECTEKTKAYIKKYVPGLVRHISPRKVKGHIRYGLNEPYNTARITGYLSLMPFVYHKKLYLEPDFHNRVFEGNIELKGRVRFAYILRIALKRHIWSTLKAMRSL